MLTHPVADSILFELKAINRRLDLLEKQLPVVDKTWLTPSEMAKICGVTTRTMQNYVLSGRLSRAAYKQEPKGKTFNYRYHRELVLRELGH